MNGDKIRTDRFLDYISKPPFLIDQSRHGELFQSFVTFMADYFTIQYQN